jgi:hypothetical protein
MKLEVGSIIYVPELDKEVMVLEVRDGQPVKGSISVNDHITPADIVDLTMKTWEFVTIVSKIIRFLRPFIRSLFKR